MKNIIVIIFFLIAICFTPETFAQSSASVDINNNINSTNNSNSNIESHTDITVETDGEVTHYSSDEPNQKIEVKSENGESSIKVNGSKIRDKESNEEINKNSKPSPISEITPTPTPQANIVEFFKDKFNFVEKIFSFFDSLKK